MTMTQIIFKRCKVYRFTLSIKLNDSKAYSEIRGVNQGLHYFTPTTLVKITP